jgi:hypothetical protein
MTVGDSHLSDEQLLGHADGELPARAAKHAAAHLDICWKCRTRLRELETAIDDFVRLHQLDMGRGLPPPSGPRALLKARLSQLHASKPRWLAVRFAGAFALCALLALGAIAFLPGRPHSGTMVVSTPDSTLTPGATLRVDRRAVCAGQNENNRLVPVTLRRKVLEHYGMSGADPRAYEIDYLVTPALGGAEDIHNLWPHSYSSTVWNARVKDALENRLRDMVCNGDLELATAQNEIATDWIGAYRKYFRTEVPLPEHGN